MNERELFPIGDVARRTGPSVSASRFHVDEGLVVPTGPTEDGFRRYDEHAIARQELVRTLRDLGADRADIRRVPTEETSLHALRSHLPEEPSTEQLEAWVELAKFVRGEEGKLTTSPEMSARVEKHRKLLLEAQASQQAGVAADSAELIAAISGEHDVDVAKSRCDIVEFDRNGKPPQWQPRGPASSC
ncbi:MerR family transcriptional regulator [Streptomyces sp. NPDC051642]|uniref:MerR family transcriptional regulator n=1 Tax=Streptomyces sp. NPDC051642 TaxID=3154646 RepID=UPI00341BBAC7